MAWLFAALSSIGFIEVLVRVPFFATLQTFQKILMQVASVIRSDRISDHWKEKVLPHYAFAMLRDSLMVGTSILAAFLPFIAFTAVADALDVPLLDFTLSWKGTTFCTVVALGYAKLRFALVHA